VALLVQRHQEHLMGLQVTQDFGAVMGFTHGVAQLAAKALLGAVSYRNACTSAGRQSITSSSR
jgi:hypothetical protein